MRNLTSVSRRKKPPIPTSSWYPELTRTLAQQMQLQGFPSLLGRLSEPPPALSTCQGWSVTAAALTGDFCICQDEWFASKALGRAGKQGAH